MTNMLDWFKDLVKFIGCEFFGLLTIIIAAVLVCTGMFVYVFAIIPNL